MASVKVKDALERLQHMQREKDPWNPIYQSLSETFLTRNADFTQTILPAQFIQDTIFNNAPQFAAFVSASVFLSTLWPDSSRTFRLEAVDQIQGFPGVEKYFRAVTVRMHLAMDRPEAGLQLALMGYLLDQVVFGISGIATLKGQDDEPMTPVVYEAWDAKSMFVSENRQGFVDTIFILVARTVKQIVEEYGSGKRGDRVSAAVLEKFKNRKFEDKIEVLKIIEPKKPDAEKAGIAAMPYRTMHIDKDNRVLMREGAREELPAVGRFFKRVGETQGRSSGMVAMPAANSLNALTEAILVATEKQLDPPLAISDDARLGGGVLDTSASAVNVVNMSGRLGNQKPIFELFTVGELQSSEKLKEQLTGEVTQAFFLDRLLDLNNKTVMTAFETSVRNRLRGESVGSIFARQIMEVLNPTIHATFRTMYRAGHFGVVDKGPGVAQRQKWLSITGKDDIQVPEVVQKAIDEGLEVYEIEYISPARRFMQAEKLQGLFTAQDSIAALANIYPSIVHGVDPDKLRADIYKYSGAPIESLRTKEETDAARAEDAKRQDAQNALAAGKDMADIAAKGAAARAALGTIPS